MKLSSLVFSILIALFFSGCLGGGTHGSIKCYIYDTPKYALEKAVHNIISQNPNIHQDSIKEYYNDDTTYITMSILYEEQSYRYIYRFGGGKQDWDTAKVSSVFIAYAYNSKGVGGSAGNGGVKWYYFKLRRELIEPFEQEFISKIDKELGIKHTED